MTANEIAHLRGLYEKGTPGEWRNEEQRVVCEQSPAVAKCFGGASADHDAALIVDRIIALDSENSALRAENARLREALADLPEPLDNEVLVLRYRVRRAVVAGDFDVYAYVTLTGMLGKIRNALAGEGKP